MEGIKHVILQPSPKQDKKYRLVVSTPTKTAHIDFGAKAYQDFTLHHDPLRKQRYLSRFRSLIEKHKDNPLAPTTLSTFLLWNKKSLESSFKDYLKKFHLKGRLDL